MRRTYVCACATSIFHNTLSHKVTVEFINEMWSFRISRKSLRFPAAQFEISVTEHFVNQLFSLSKLWIGSNLALADVKTFPPVANVQLAKCEFPRKRSIKILAFRDFAGCVWNSWSLAFFYFILRLLPLTSEARGRALKILAKCIEIKGSIRIKRHLQPIERICKIVRTTSPLL